MKYFDIPETISFDDVLLLPQYSEIESRDGVAIGSSLKNFRYIDVPIISSPMDTITEDAMGIAMDRIGGFGIVHRYNTIEEQLKIVDKMIYEGEDDVHWDVIKSAAIGVTGDYYERAKELLDHGIDILCIDVAHGDHILVKKAIEKIKGNLSKYKFHLMAGNIATGEAYERMAQWGVDSIRVGVGSGGICSTRLKTGHGMSILQSLLFCNSKRNDMCYYSNSIDSIYELPSIIADGGIRNSADCVKAYAAGADFVMIGSLLAGTVETPGYVYPKDNKFYKLYRGMASTEAQIVKGGKMAATPEGISTDVEYTGKIVKEVIDNLVGGIKSGFSYSGANSMSVFKQKAKVIQQTNAGQNESFTHILFNKNVHERK